MAPDAQVISAVENPDMANRIAAMTAAEERSVEPPAPPAPSDTEVTLPGGLDTPTGKVHDVEVRELTGDDEEKIARSRDVASLKTKLVELGVVAIAGEKPSKGLLGDLLIGDRDFLIMKIRQATYGDTADLDVTCQTCGEEQEVIYDFEADVPIKALDGDAVFDVDLRDGRRATVELPRASHENDALKALSSKATTAELNTLLLGACLVAIDGEPSMGPSTARALGMGDRQRLLKAIGDKQVGPQFTDVKYECGACGAAAPLVIDVLEMFRG